MTEPEFELRKSGTILFNILLYHSRIIGGQIRILKLGNQILDWVLWERRWGLRLKWGLQFGQESLRGHGWVRKGLVGLRGSLECACLFGRTESGWLVFGNVITVQRGDFNLPWKLLNFRNSAYLPSKAHWGSTLIPPASGCPACCRFHNV